MGPMRGVNKGVCKGDGVGISWAHAEKPLDLGRVTVLGLAGGSGIFGAGEYPSVGEHPGRLVNTLRRLSFVQLCGNVVLAVSMLHFRSHRSTQSSSSSDSGIGFVLKE